MNWETLETDIRDIFSSYVATQSTSGTPGEREAQDFLIRWFAGQPYFRDHPDLWGKQPVEGDPLNRHVVWGMVRGKGPGTLVLIHHYDVVDASDFGNLEPWAHNTAEIGPKLEASGIALDPEAQKDLSDPNWQFGRGSADMKAGGAIQMALVKAFARETDLAGNILICCLPDEENLSAGMRAALPLLDRLKSDHGLDYRLMIDSEPHEREDGTTGIIYEGSVGKIMPFVYARGVLAHSGRIFEGLNPIHLLSELLIRTELNMDFSEQAGGQVLPPPSWLYFKDGKQAYDVSIPTHACAYMNALTLAVSPALFLERLGRIAFQAFDAVLERVDNAYQTFMAQSGLSASALPWQPRVLTFSQLYCQVLAREGSEFKARFLARLNRLKTRIDAGDLTLMAASFAMVEFCLANLGDNAPIMVIGISPPYYPHICNQRIPDLPRDIRHLSQWVNQFTTASWNQPYEAKPYFTGISDLSYAYPPGNPDDLENAAQNMPLWGPAYSIPFDSVARIGMPCVNIGPWGKDLHKLTERVNLVDLYQRTPRILYHLIHHLLETDQAE